MRRWTTTCGASPRRPARTWKGRSAFAPGSRTWVAAGNEYEENVLVGFLHNLLRRLSLRGRRGGSAPRRGEVHVAAFGKHPGWDDHVELGLDTTRLAEVRQWLYVEGIAGNVDSGAWD